MPTSAINVAAKSAVAHESGAAKALSAIPTIERNVGDIERVVSLGIGGFLTVCGIRKTNPLALGASAFFLYRGLSGNCPLTQALHGLRTSQSHSVIPARTGVRVEHAVMVQRPVGDLYDTWRDLSRLPRFMSHLVAVREETPTKSHWIARGPLGIKVEWDAEIINDIRDAVIAWRSLPGSDIDTAGSVHFKRVPEGHWTEVRVNLKYDAPAGRIGSAVACLFGQNPKQQIQQDMERFKRLMEAGEIAKKSFQPANEV